MTTISYQTLTKSYIVTSTKFSTMSHTFIITTSTISSSESPCSTGTSISTGTHLSRTHDLITTQQNTRYSTTETTKIANFITNH